MNARSFHRSASPSGVADVATLQRKAEDYDHLVHQMRRVTDDFTRRRHVMEVECVKRIGEAIEKFARDLLPIADDFEALTGARGKAMSHEALGDALSILEARLLDVFRQHGIRPIEAKVGDVFDSRIHEALWVVESSDSEPNRLAQIVERGFWLHDRLLRPTRVTVIVRPEEVSPKIK